VNSDYDTLSGYTIWDAYFSKTDKSFRLVSVGDKGNEFDSLDKWAGKCVVIRGTLTDRSTQDPNFKTGPVMLNTQDNSSYIIGEAPLGFCQQ
jgi:hypothetical protein